MQPWWRPDDGLQHQHISLKWNVHTDSMRKVRDKQEKRTAVGIVRTYLRGEKKILFAPMNVTEATTNQMNSCAFHTPPRNARAIHRMHCFPFFSFCLNRKKNLNKWNFYCRKCAAWYFYSVAFETFIRFDLRMSSAHRFCVFVCVCECSCVRLFCTSLFRLASS